MEIYGTLGHCLWPPDVKEVAVLQSKGYTDDATGTGWPPDDIDISFFREDTVNLMLPLADFVFFND